MSYKFKLKKGDEVIVLTGKDKGKTGKIVKMIPKKMKAIVAEINNALFFKKSNLDISKLLLENKLKINLKHLKISSSNKGREPIAFALKKIKKIVENKILLFW